MYLEADNTDEERHLQNWYAHNVSHHLKWDMGNVFWISIVYLFYFILLLLHGLERRLMKSSFVCQKNMKKSSFCMGPHSLPHERGSPTLVCLQNVFSI
jgi:hypothetical protein